MAHGIAIGHFLILVGLDEQPGPRPAKHGLQVRLDSRPFFGGHAAIDKLAVVIGRGGHVERALLAALDLEAGHPGGAQGWQVIGQGQVFHGEGEARGRIAADFGTVTQGERSAGDFIGIATGIGAFPAVAGTAEGLRRKKTQAAVSITQCAVDEDFRFNAGGARDVVDFLEGQFAGQHNAREAKLLDAPPGPIVNRHLRAAMQLQTGKMTADGAVHTEILQDDRIDAEIFQRGKGVDQFGKLVLANERIDGHENTPAPLQSMRVGDDFTQFLKREVFGLRPSGEFLEAKVDGVGAVMESGESRIQAARRGKELDGLIARACC